MDFEFFEEGASKVLLIVELFHEVAVRINLLQVLDDADLLALIYLLVVFKKLLDDLFEHALLGSVFRLWDEGLISLTTLLFLL